MVLVHDLVLDRSGRGSSGPFRGLRHRRGLPDVPRAQNQPQAQPYTLVRHRHHAGGRRGLLLLLAQLQGDPAHGHAYRRAGSGFGHCRYRHGVRALPPLRGSAHSTGGHRAFGVRAFVPDGPQRRHRELRVQRRAEALLHLERRLGHAHQRVLHLHRAVHHLRRLP